MINFCQNISSVSRLKHVTRRVNCRVHKKMLINASRYFFGIFCCFSSWNMWFYHFHFFFFEVWNFCNRILTNQKHELVVSNCQWNCMWPRNPCLFSVRKKVSVIYWLNKEMFLLWKWKETENGNQIKQKQHYDNITSRKSYWCTSCMPFKSRTCTFWPNHPIFWFV